MGVNYGLEDVLPNGPLFLLHYDRTVIVVTTASFCYTAKNERVVVYIWPVLYTRDTYFLGGKYCMDFFKLNRA